MVDRHATPAADTTISHHLPPPEDDSTQDVSVSFAIPPQADATNLLDQNYDDFLSGPGLITLSTPVLPRHLANTTRSVSKMAGTIRTRAVLSSPNLGQTATELDPPNCRTELEETRMLLNSPPALSPSTKPTHFHCRSRPIPTHPRNVEWQPRFENLQRPNIKHNAVNGIYYRHRSV